ncbi:MAG: hypothetical protein ACYC2O_13965, partial [Microthrixaceae bacterium]
MRYEAMRLLQFLFSLTLIVGAFAAGVLAGWYRWAPRRGRPDDDGSLDQDAAAGATSGAGAGPGAGGPGAGGPGGQPSSDRGRAAEPGRSPLFSPEGRGWGGRASP